MGTDNLGPCWTRDVFDFDDWADTYQRDPDAFERRRARWIDAYIQSAPAPQRARLRGLMFRVDMERRRARNPLDACVRLSGMMWDKLTEMQQHLNGGRPANRPRFEAEVIAFPSKRR